MTQILPQAPSTLQFKDGGGNCLNHASVDGDSGAMTGPDKIRE
jgi:hypothetical protein